MSVATVYYRVRYMEIGDIDAVIAIEHASFTTPWAPGTYARELNSTDYSHMVVVERVEQIPSLNRFHAIWRQIVGRAAPTRTVLGYGGLWLFGAEAHISTIASHPRYRGQGWGELTLLAMMRRARALQATYATLEVRVSNERAQRLYKKYGFDVVGVKKRYYTDDREDAYEMQAPLNKESVQQYLNARYSAYKIQIPFKDTFSTGP
ncbi:MAG: ribosomal protein S18-alanine N-acetyltransferase, partial [Chloroflexota bacterium]